MFSYIGDVSRTNIVRRPVYLAIMGVSWGLEGAAAQSPLVECRRELLRADPTAIANTHSTPIHTNRHYKRASGALLVYDVTSRSSFENAEKVWLRELKNAADSNSSLLDSLVLVGNKVGRSGVVFITLASALAAMNRARASVCVVMVSVVHHIRCDL